MQQIAVYNLLGQCVLEQKAKRSQAVIDLHEAASGMYLLRITTECGELNKRIAIIH